MTQFSAAEPPRPHFTVASGRVVSAVDSAGGAGRASAGSLRQFRRIVVMTQGRSTPEFAKTAIQLLRYRTADVCAVIDRNHAGSSAAEVFGVGGHTPVVGSLSEVAAPDSLFVGIAPPGGRLPDEWRAVILEALCAGLTVVSGLHDRLSDDRRLNVAAGDHGGRLIDLRSSDHRRPAEALPMRSECFRVLTVGTDCAVGKMSAAKELELGLQSRGRGARFLATGQTGMMIGGHGAVVDAVVSDFINGAVERLVVDHQENDYLVIEGQGSIVHPAYSAVSLGLLHGARPQALVLCHELGREHLKSAPHVAVRPLEELIRLHEAIGSIRQPCRVVGLALNGSRLSTAASSEQAERLEQETGLPACDVYRDGPDRLVEAIERHKHASEDARARQSTAEATL